MRTPGEVQSIGELDGVLPERYELSASGWVFVEEPGRAETPQVRG